MPHLKTLNLSYCSNITDKCLEYFKDLKQLEKLDLCFCPDITGEGFEYFSALNQLKTINLRGSSARADRNYFNDVGLSFLESKINMEKLDLTGCHLITDKGLNYLARMYGLKILNLSEMEKITTQGLENMFKEMKHIQSLSIKDCSNVKSFKFLSKMPQLKFLVLSGPISGNIAFEGLENLEELDLAYTDVTDKDLESLNELKKLKILYLGKNVTEAFVKNLKKSLSNTFISLTCEAF
jgi:Leucine-rich repeat (LRR) protein